MSGRSLHCRVCLSTQTSANTKETAPTLNFKELFMTLTGLEVNDDNFMLCDKCTEQLETFNLFRSLAHKNESFFTVPSENENFEDFEPTETETEKASEEVFEEIDVKRRKITQFFCNYCFEEFKASRERKKHEENVHIGPNGGLECDFCGKRYPRLKIIAHIKQSHLWNKRFECDECDAVFLFKVGLVSHVAIQHAKVKPKFQCDQCPKHYVTRAKLRSHIRIKHECKLSVPCKECGKAFTSSSYMKDHYDAVHLRLRLHACSVCGKTYGSRATLVNHQKLHATEATHKCDECERTYKTNAALTRHKRVRHRPDFFPYCCHVCGGRYRESTGLRIHSFSHMTPSFQCDHCNKLFSRKMSLKNHIKTVHEGEKVSCEVCGQEFTSSSAMAKHKKIVHLGFRYRCSCGKEYRKKCSYMDHKQSCPDAVPELITVNNVKNAK